MKNSKTRRLAVCGLLAAVCLLLNLTKLGIIPIPPTGIAILHIPVIIGVILEGPVVGLALGLVFGLSSMWAAVTMPTPLSPLFLDPLVAVLPRLLIPLSAWGTLRCSNKIFRKTRVRPHLSCAFAAIAGTLTNTVFVLLIIFLRYGDKFSELMTVPREAVLGAIIAIGATNGLFESIAAVVICTAIAGALRRFYPEIKPTKEQVS